MQNTSLNCSFAKLGITIDTESNTKEYVYKIMRTLLLPSLIPHQIIQLIM